MPIRRNLALKVSFLLGFAVLAAVFSWLNGPQGDVLVALAICAGISVLVLWIAGARRQ